GGTLLANAPLSPANFSQSGGTLDGPASFTVTNTYAWTGGIMTGSGSTRIPAGAILTISGIADKQLNGRTILNAGTTTWTDVSYYTPYGSTAGTFTNQA